MKKKLMIILPLLLLPLGYFGYSHFMAAKPKKEVMKIKGELVSVGEPFTLNLDAPLPVVIDGDLNAGKR